MKSTTTDRMYADIFVKKFLSKGRAAEKGISIYDVDPKQLKKGIKVEMEHTSDRKIATRIALDHLAEHPRYYDYLEAMEASW